MLEVANECCRTLRALPTSDQVDMNCYVDSTKSSARTQAAGNASAPRNGRLMHVLPDGKFLSSAENPGLLLA